MANHYRNDAASWMTGCSVALCLGPLAHGATAEADSPMAALEQQAEAILAAKTLDEVVHLMPEAHAARAREMAAEDKAAALEKWNQRTQQMRPTAERVASDEAVVLLAMEPAGDTLGIRLLRMSRVEGSWQTTDDDAYADCVAKLKIRGSGSGFFSFKGGQLDRSYTGQVERKIGKGQDMGGDEGEPYFFVLSAASTVSTTDEGVPVIAELVLSVAPVDAALDEASYPRGIHWVGFRHNQHDRLHICRRDDGRKIVDVSDGTVLISRAGRDLIEGSLFVGRFFNFSTSLSAIAGDEPVKELTAITFRFEN